MILSKQKPFEEILEALKSYEKIFVMGCPECATACMTGGEEQIAEIKKKLEEAGKKVVACIMGEGGLCTMPPTKHTLTGHREAVKEADCFLSYGCGTGAHALLLIANKPSISGTDTLGLAVEAPLKEFLERCSACGECEFGWSLGLCPVTLCSKGMLNGPCGGMEKGKCEVSKERDCGWVKIYDKLKEFGKLENLEKIRFKNHKKSNKPREVKLEV